MVTTSSVRPVVLRNGVGIEDPLSVVLDFLRAYRRLGISDPAQPAAFGEPDLRLANRGGARISAAEIAAILERRGAIEGALRGIAPGVSLAGAADSVPWLVLRQLFDAFADIRGVGFAKMTKALHPKRPALIPMLDSIVQSTCEMTTSEPTLRSESARSGSYTATNAIWIATGRRCGRCGRSSRGAGTRSPRCGSSTC